MPHQSEAPSAPQPITVRMVASEVLTVRLTPLERQRLEVAATREGVTVSTVTRDALACYLSDQAG